ncbi:uncharacterized protein ACLA_077930 [Aspergillus clavatus NRRL 1]|uniref:Uncharacterized protein n=1 Tax=Aspergillus clavatus (strain ATCC 1007 / CBS 513.65 / DSM 816 / NCTC 3887 / NRRL 1 / QM 1276 / 107) TaxID=344612 RepID=A1CLR7_ASPCL|nr:uncharacterized protein ACLA_077930 [Aspergillus clavatus NRRL 1]EAW09046.1 conserved hypothetical protein [Aspergillus clavatus NRRL 1]
MQVATWSYENPLLAACAVGVVTGVAVVAAPGLATAPVLSTLGFTASGVKAGSLAAAVHSTIGNAVAGSALAISQSAGAGGAGLAVINGAAQVGGAAMSIGSVGLAWAKSKL